LNTEGDANTATGNFALLGNITGTGNTAVGSGALFSNNGDLNTAVGFQSLNSNTGGNANTAVVENALSANVSGLGNTAVGSNSLINATGDDNIAVGSGAGIFVTTADNVICIGVAGENVSNSCYIANIFGESSPSGVGVFISSNGKLGTNTSSLRFKEEIKPMDKASEALFSLKPVSFRYKKEIDLAGTQQFGLVAEEVEAVHPDLVVRDKEGKPYSVRYDQVNAMLLNEFIKEHRKVQEQKATITQLESALAKQGAAIARQRKDFDATITELKKEMETVFARFTEQDAKIQSVSDQIEMGRRALNTALNNQ
jgi:uncharacterized coiled-coil protein SlyX